MQWELLFFLKTILVGMAWSVFYDGIRCIRRVWKHKGKLVAIEDILFWIGAGIGIYIFLYEQNKGNVRIYQLAAMIAGSSLYYLCFSYWLQKVFVFLMKQVKKLTEIPAKIFLFFIKRLKLKALRVTLYLKMLKKKKCRNNGEKKNERKKSK